jgi:hypothetical protein
VPAERSPTPGSPGPLCESGPALPTFSKPPYPIVGHLSALAAFQKALPSCKARQLTLGAV